MYLLSSAEVCNAAYGFDTEFGNESKTRESKNTDYAKLKGAWNDIYYGYDGTGDWWLRSRDYDDWYVSFVGYDGGCVASNEVDNSDYGVRPVLHINFPSSKMKDAGEVDSDGNITALSDGIYSPRVKDGVTTWDCVYFGNYSQSSTFEKKALEWRMLSVDGDDAFLLADRNLDAKPYNEERKDVIWKTCTLRKWLNEDFYNEAFDAEEKKAVQETRVVNGYSDEHGTEGDNDTTDKVYILSETEVCSAAYGFDTKFRMSKIRESKNTDFVKTNNAYTSTVSSTSGNGRWWLRSSEYYSENAKFVDCHGGAPDDYYYVDLNYIAVRPALHINLSSSLWSKAGEVRLDRQGDNRPTESPEPTKKPGATEKPTSTAEPTKKPNATEKPTPTADPTKKPDVTEKPVSTSEPTKKPDGTTKPNTMPNPSVPDSSVTAQPEPQSTTPLYQPYSPVLKKLKLSSVKCAKNAKKITGKVSVSKASIKIKVGKKAYKKAAVKGKKFTLKLNYKLIKKTKVTIKAEKKGYKSVVKSYKVK